jgi:membrane associated rhomboid family serine protease
MIPLHDDNPTETTPVVTVAFVAACALVFLYQATLPPRTGEAFVFHFGAIPAVLFGRAELPPEIAGFPAYATLLTSMFMHGGWMHLIGNMLYLWIFGNNIEDVMGHARFILFYVLCGILAAFSHALTDPTSTVPMVGASGAISGVLGAYLLLFPKAQVLVFIPLGFFTRALCGGSGSSCNS